VLRDQPDAGRLRLVRRGRARQRAIADPDLAGVGALESGEDPHQRRLAGPVLADQRVHRLHGCGDRDIVERDEGAERLSDVGERKAAPPGEIPRRAGPVLGARQAHLWPTNHFG
jgi:hypothetical protein